VLHSRDLPACVLPMTEHLDGRNPATAGRAGDVTLTIVGTPMTGAGSLGRAPVGARGRCRRSRESGTLCRPPSTASVEESPWTSRVRVGTETSMALDVSPATLRRTPVAVALIALNVAVFAALTLATRLEDALGLPAGWDAVVDAPWTLVTVIVTAGNLLHLAGAVAFIFFFGRELERLAGGLHLLAVYVLAGVAGSIALTSVASTTGMDGVSLGASASFLGLFGAVAVLPRWERLERFPVLPILAAIIVVNIAAPLLGLGGWESPAAHGAGLGVGALYGWALRAGGRVRDAAAEV
jgi:rhomboid protease GluP